MAEALHHYAASIELAPAVVELAAYAWRGRGATLSALERHAEALSSFTAAMALAPASREAREAWESTANNMSIIMLRPVIYRAGSTSNGANIYSNRNRPPSKKTFCSSALANQFGSCPNYHKIGRDNDLVYHTVDSLRQGTVRVQDDWLLALDAAVATLTWFAEAHRMRGVALANVGRSAEGLAACRRAVATNPQDAEVSVGVHKITQMHIHRVFLNA